MRYLVYWLHFEDHSDPYQEGYVGITGERIERRLGKHHLPKKHPNLTVKILHERLTLTRALRLEKMYRPRARIGLNTCAGGGHC
jgi:hypothetical protein